ncbi:MAG: choice-of-anchor D domain-containing protein, partial [Solirubrobacterales bacterium]
MSKSDLTINPTGTARGLSGHRRLLSLVVGLVAFAGVALAGPVASQAAQTMSSTNSTGTNINGTTQTFTTVPTASSATSKQFFMVSSDFVLSSTTRRSVITISGPGASAFQNGTGCSMDQISGDGLSFRTNYSQGGFSGSGNCSFTVLTKSGLAPGTYTATMSYTNNSNFTSGSATLVANVTEENGAVIRVYDQNNTQGPFDFGGVAVGDSSTRTFTVKNTGTTAVTGGARALSGNAAYSITGGTCTASLATLAILSSCTVDVKYQPTVVSAGDNTTLNITSTSGHSRSFNMTGQAFNPVADISVTPMTWDYGDVASTYPRSKAFTVSNTGNTTLNLSYVTDTDPLVVYRNGGTCGATLAVGNSCTMIVNFDPASSGAAAQTGSFTVSGSTPLVGSPATKTVNVQGNRVAAVAGIEARDTAGVNQV